MITGSGVAADEVREKIGSDRVQMLGLVDDERLEAELVKADVAFVSQQHDGTEFNIPSKLMNFMTYGLPVLAAVNPQSEAARIIEQSDGGWAVDSSRPEGFPEKVAGVWPAKTPSLRRRAGPPQRTRRSFQACPLTVFDAALRDVVSVLGAP